MPIAVGDKLPDATFKVRTAEGLKDMTTAELFGGKRVVLFAVPGAFTPTCSDHHLPGFVLQADEILAKGVDRIACVAVNDPFVMNAWGNAQNTGDKILMLADGNGDFAAEAGLSLDLTGLGLGTRSQRYAAILQDGVVTQLWIETNPGGVDVSGSDKVLKAL